MLSRISSPRVGSSTSTRRASRQAQTLPIVPGRAVNIWCWVRISITGSRQCCRRERTGFHHQRPEPLVWILIALQECEGEVIALTCSPTSVPR